MDYKDTLMRFTMAAKAIIYNPDRALSLVKMMATKQGTLTAVHTVMAGIDKQKPITPDLAPMLAVIIMMLLVDVAKQALKTQPSQQVLDATIKMIMDDAHKTYPVGQAPNAPSPMPTAPMKPTGLINQGAPA